jgi:hypothetical protein
MYGLCPVFLKDDGDVLVAVPRHRSLNWLYDISSALMVLAMRVTGNYGWSCLVTGELAHPRLIEMPD